MMAMITVFDEKNYRCKDTYINLNNGDTKMTDTFRKEYRPLDEDQKANIVRIKDKAADLFNALNLAAELQHEPRCIALAKTNLEQAVMWAIKAIT
jgi:hypothetical protein